MRVFASALLALLASGPDFSGRGELAVTIGASSLPGSCVVTSSATIVAYDARTAREVVYHFTHSDGSVSGSGRLAFSGNGAAAQSVRDTWTPRGKHPWVAVDITQPERVRSRRVMLSPPCERGIVATVRAKAAAP